MGRTGRCSRPGRHYGLPRYAVHPAGPAAELERSAHGTKVEASMRLSRCFPVALWGAIACASLSLPVPASAQVTEGVLHMTQVT